MSFKTKQELSLGKFIQESGFTLNLSGTTIVFGKLQYDSSVLITGSTQVTTKSYVDNKLLTGSTANNGLTKIGNNISLGGTLTGNTTISMDQYNLIFEPSSNYQLLGFGTNDFPLSNIEARTGGAGSQTQFRAVSGSSIYLRNFDAVANNSVGEIALTDNTVYSGLTLFNYDGYNTQIRSLNSGFTTNHELRFTTNNVKFYDNKTIKTGIEYNADYTTGFTSLSLVHKGYVDNKNNTIIGITANTLLTNSIDYVLVNSSSSGLTVTLPSTPDSSKKITVKDRTGNALSNNITIDGNGKNIDGVSTALIDTNRGSLQFIYSDEFDEWYIIGFLN